MSHPVSQMTRYNLSLESPIGDANTGNPLELKDVIAVDNVEPSSKVEINENFNKELDLLNSVIEEQIQSTQRMGLPGTLMQKLVMYESYQNMIKKYPEDMVSYLVHRKQRTDFPLQAKIFQEYVSLMIDALPFNIVRQNSIHEVISLFDPCISLFLGISEFESIVRDDLSIPNNTQELYTGERKFSYDSPCFIGWIIDITDLDNCESIKSMIKDYSFMQIKMMPGVKPGTKVKVKHARIPSHYEMGSLVFLQHARKRIVNRLQYKLKNG
jgi:hypothetical protein